MKHKKIEDTFQKCIQDEHWDEDLLYLIIKYNKPLKTTWSYCLKYWDYSPCSLCKIEATDLKVISNQEIFSKNLIWKRDVHVSNFRKWNEIKIWCAAICHCFRQRLVSKSMSGISYQTLSQIPDNVLVTRHYLGYQTMS